MEQEQKELPLWQETYPNGDQRQLNDAGYCIACSDFVTRAKPTLKQLTGKSREDWKEVEKSAEDAFFGIYRKWGIDEKTCRKLAQESAAEFSYKASTILTKGKIRSAD